MTINCVADLSHHNGHVDFGSAKSELLAVFLKATQGETFVDDTFKARLKPAQEAGLLVGAYHFATRKPVESQAKHFLETVGDPAGLVLAIDIEQDTDKHGNPLPSVTLGQARELVEAVHEQTGRWPVIYAGHYLKELLDGQEDEVLGNCPLWWAQYGPAPKWPKQVWDTLTFWQYTDGVHGDTPHEVEGIGPCDRDKFYGSEDELKAFWVGSAIAGASHPLSEGMESMSVLTSVSHPMQAGLNGVILESARARSDKDAVPNLLQQGSTVEGLKAAREAAKKELKEYPHNGCAAHLSALLIHAGIDVPMTLGAGKLAKRLKERGWTRLSVGEQQSGDVGVTYDTDKSINGADHIYLVLEAIDQDAMIIADNQDKKPHKRRASGHGKTPTEYFLRA